MQAEITKKRKRDEKITKAIMATNDQLKDSYAQASGKKSSITAGNNLKKEWINIRDEVDTVYVLREDIDQLNLPLREQPTHTKPLNTE